MSTPDARLSAAERAALASLEAAAAAEDPHLAARLRGSAQSRAKQVAPLVLAYLRGRWNTVLRARWWGVVVAAAGLTLMFVGLSSSLVVSVLGALLCAVGLRVIAQMIVGRRRREPEQPE